MAYNVFGGMLNLTQP